MKKRKGFTLIELLVVIAIVALLMSILVPALNRAKILAQRLVCASNLKGIGNALGVYAGESLGSIAPVAGVPWTAPVTDETNLAYVRAGLAPDPITGETKRAVWTNIGTLFRPYDSLDVARAFNNGATITSSLYLLIKYTRITPNQFNCPGDTGVLEFKLKNMNADDTLTLYDIWDFGRGVTDSASGLPPMVMPGEFCSYAYHMPYVSGYGPMGPSSIMSFAINENSSPGSPVCADRNPFLDRNATGARLPTLDEVTNMIGVDRHDNSVCHGGGEGQNVLFKDNSVGFYKTPNVGLREDHIYTYGNDIDIGDSMEGGSKIGTRPVHNGDGGPTGFKDAYLVGEKNAEW